MKCEDVELRLPEYLEGQLPEADARQVNAHMARCPACARALEVQRRIDAAFRAAPEPRPGPRLDALFHTWLEAEREEASVRSREEAPVRYSWLRSLMNHGATAVAACVLFAAGMLIGPRLGNDTDARLAETTAAELTELRRQLVAMDAAVSWAVAAQRPVSERFETVRALEQAPAEARTRHELLGVLAYDPSPTVRQKAVEALYRYADEPAVRNAVAVALPRETSPVVQLAMIDLLAATRDPVAASALESFARSETSASVVGQAAGMALTRM